MKTIDAIICTDESGYKTGVDAPAPFPPGAFDPGHGSGRSSARRLPLIAANHFKGRSAGLNPKEFLQTADIKTEGAMPLLKGAVWPLKAHHPRQTALRHNPIL